MNQKTSWVGVCALVLVCLIESSLFSAEEKAAGGPFYGSSRSTIYHVGSCEWASKIGRDNLIVFNSREGAESKNYRPCKVCRPEEMKVFSSVQSDKYHLWNCEWTGRMLVQNIRAFKSVKDAQSAGKKACEVCRP